LRLIIVEGKSRVNLRLLCPFGEGWTFMADQPQNPGKLLLVGQDAACAEFLAKALGNLCCIRVVE